MQAPALQIPKGLLCTKMHTQGHQLTEAMHLAAYRFDSGHQASRAGHAIPGYSAWHIPCSRNGLGSSAQELLLHCDRTTQARAAYIRR